MATSAHVSICDVAEEVVDVGLGRVSFEAARRVNSAHAVNRANDHMVQMPACEQVRLLSKQDLHNGPNHLSHLVIDRQRLAHLVHPQCCDVQHAMEKLVITLKELVLVALLRLELVKA